MVIAHIFLTLFYLWPNYGRFQDESFKNKFESAYDHLDTEGNPKAMVFHLMDHLRRLIFAGSAVYMAFNGSLQVFVMIYVTLAVVIINIHIKPLESKFKNRMALYDECTILLIGCWLLGCTDVMTIPIGRTIIGFWLIFLISQNVVVNLLLLLRIALKSVKRLAKKLYAIRKKLGTL